LPFGGVLFRLLPLARRRLPRAIQRFLLLRALHVNRPYDQVFKAPSRLCLEQEILPRLAERFSRILFVGTA